MNQFVRYIVSLIPIGFLVFFFIVFQGAAIIFAIAFAVPLIVLASLSYSSWNNTSKRRLLVAVPLGLVGIVVGGTIVVVVIFKYGEWKQDHRTATNLQEMADQISFEIYTPGSKNPDYIELSTDGPIADPSFINPKTGINNLGVVVTTGEANIYDKRKIPNDFGGCAPRDVRTYYQTDKEVISKKGCKKIATTPKGIDVYVYDRGNETFFVFDRNNSRIVLTHVASSNRSYTKPNLCLSGTCYFYPANHKRIEISAGQWYIPDDFMQYVDSFQPVPLKGIVVRYGNSKSYIIK